MVSFRYAYRLRSESEDNRTGVLSYDTPATASIPLQTLLSPLNITHLQKLLPDPSGLPSGMLKAQYELQTKYFLEGKVGWAELLLLAAGGVASTPAAGVSYSTPIVFNLVRFLHSMLYLFC
jgi:hypothetical protein